jgi:hypothetical protein
MTFTWRYEKAIGLEGDVNEIDKFAINIQNQMFKNILQTVWSMSSIRRTRRSFLCAIWTLPNQSLMISKQEFYLSTTRVKT